MRIYWELFWTFVKLGATTFGGGYAMLPLLEAEVVNRKGWATKEELMDYYAIGQCTPGIISVNTATFIGKKTTGNLGGIIATLGLVFPSLVIIMAITAFIGNFTDIPAVGYAFAGIRVCVCVLIFNAILSLWKKAVVDLWTLLLFLAVFFAATFTELSPILFVLISAVAGIAINALKEAKK